MIGYYNNQPKLPACVYIYIYICTLCLHYAMLEHSPFVFFLFFSQRHLLITSILDNSIEKKDEQI